MSIILRTNKGSALTYDEMDRNQSQFFYSSSLHNSKTRLRLHYTGSDSLDTATEDYGPTRYHEINLDPTEIEIPEAIAAGDDTQIQFNQNGSFGANSNFVFDYTHKRLGIGTADPQVRLDIAGSNSQQAAITLRGFSSGTGDEKNAKISFNEGSTLIGKIGRIVGDNEHLYIVNNKQVVGASKGSFNKVHIGAGPDGADSANVAATFHGRGASSRFGVNTQTPNRMGTFVGQLGIGISATASDLNQSFLRPIPSGIYSKFNDSGQRRLIPHQSTTEGLLISSPAEANGGNIVVALNTDNSEFEGFNIINAFEGSYSNSEVIFSAQASGKVGINTNFPSVEGLTVDGIISGSGNAQIDGTLTVKTVAAVTGTGTNKTLVADSNGLINYLPAAPVPFGGIIMWSGNTNAVPEGWVLCNLNSSVTTGLGTRFVPDLTNKFIIGWNGDEAGSGPKTDITGTDTTEGGSKDAIVVSHSHPITDPGHRHIINHRLDSSAAGNFLTLRGTDNADEGSWSSNGLDNGNLRSLSSTTDISVNPVGSSGTNKNLPPYYALAFIMYVGS